MSAPASFSELLNLATGGNNGTPKPYLTMKNLSKEAVGTAANKMSSLWELEGYRGQLGGAPAGSAVYPTRATAGALAQTDPGGGRKLWLTSITAHFPGSGALYLYDRLATFGGLSGTGAGAQTCALTPTRNTSGVNNEIWIEIETQIGVTARTVTASYTDPVNGSGRTTQATAIGAMGDREASRIIRLPLQSGDTGVTAMASFTLSGTTGTAGSLTAMIVNPICVLKGAVGGSCHRNFAYWPNGYPEIETGAALAWAATGTFSQGTWLMYTRMLEK